MNQSRLTQVAARIDDAQLTSPVEDLERLIAEVRDTVLGIRMMPIGTTFTRFKRLVHDLSGELGKEIDLATAGAETELDKTVIDQLDTTTLVPPGVKADVDEYLNIRMEVK